MGIRFIVGAALLVSALSGWAAEKNGPEIGQPAPNLIGRTLDEKSYRLKSDKGMPKVINFFSVTCKPCRQEMPELAQLEKEYPGIKFISVHTQEEKPETVASFVKSLPGAPSIIVLTSGGLQETFNYMGLPHTLVLDSNNIVLMNLSGYTPDNTQRLIKELQELTKH